MHIVMFSHFYPPEPVTNSAELAESLAKRGHKVSVVTGFPNYPSGHLYPGYRISLLQKESIGGVRVFRVPIYPEHSRSGIKRVANYLSFALSASTVGVLAVGKCDRVFVYGSPYTSAIPGMVLSLVRRAPMVFNVQDLWPDTLWATGMMTNRLALSIVSLFTRLVYRWSTVVIVISEGFRKALIKRGVPERKLVHLPNWADTEVMRPLSRDSAYARSIGISEKFTVLFAGYVGLAQGLETVVGAAEILKNREEIQFVIAGDGLLLGDLKELSRVKGLRNVTFIGQKPSTEMPQLYSLADALLVHLRPEPLFLLTIPHKVLGYFASGKPVIAAIAGDTAELVSATGAGIACDPGDPAALARAVVDLWILDPSERARMGQRARELAEKSFSREPLVDEMERMLSSCTRV